MLLKLLIDEAQGSRGKIIATAVISGVANAAVIDLANQGARASGHIGAGLFIKFLFACALYALCLRYCVNAVSTIFESVIYKIRLRVADKIQKAQLQQLEQIGTSEIYQRLTQETAAIAQAAWPVATIMYSVVTLVFMGLYLRHISELAFLVALVLSGSGVYIHFRGEHRAAASMRQTASMQVGLLDRLHDLLSGGKELRFRTQRRTALYGDFRQMAAAVRASAIKTNLVNEENYILFTLNLFALLASIIFILPQFSVEPASKLNALTAAVLFMFGAFSGLLWALPQYGRANLAAQNIGELEQKLEQAAGPAAADSHNPWQGPFRELRADNLQYQYNAAAGQESFAIGPLSLTIQAGEIVFIVGGNGSGKSTLVKVLTALYAPTAGRLSVDGTQLSPENAQAYRERIAAIFGDFHLFKKLYGLPEVSEEEVQRLLGVLQIANKTSFGSGSFSTLDLSTGQRKRLAMAVALLEDRPIYVFDEWAADQDPEFRRYYYEELLPELRRRDKAVIAVSHDDRYFHCADRVITMEYGQIRLVESHADPVVRAAGRLDDGTTRHG